MCAALSIAPLLGSAEDSLLSFEMVLDSPCHAGGVLFTDCGSTIEMTITIGNDQDFPVTEGSTTISESLGLEIRDSQGDVRAWWQGDDGQEPGGPRTWEPGERETLFLTWDFAPGPFAGGPPPPSDRVRSAIPSDGYSITLVWRDPNGSELFTSSSWVELLSVSFDEWRSLGAPAFFPVRVPSGGRTTLVGTGGCGSAPSWAETRWLEMGDDHHLDIYFEYWCGPWAMPTSFPVVMRLPRLAPGTYTVRLHQVSGSGHTNSAGTAVLTVTTDPMPAPFELR